MFLDCPSGYIFGKTYGNQGLNPGEALLPTAFPSFRPAVAELTHRGNGKVCFMKTTNSVRINSMNRRADQCGTVAAVLIALALVCFALLPQARATCQMGCFTDFNTAFGDDALIGNTGSYNTAVGFGALTNSTGNNNTATGASALPSNTTGFNDTAIGASALSANITGFDNTAIGFTALFINTTGYSNTATGVQALWGNTTGFWNTATGFSALGRNGTGYYNTATGVGALDFNDGGNNNTAAGVQALEFNLTGNSNTATGELALNINTTGNDNTATGVSALLSNTTGNRNVADGIGALLNNTTGSGNIALGEGAGGNLTTGNHNIDIGNRGVVGEANTIRVGRQGTHSATFIAGISGAIVPTGVAVIIDTEGHLGTVMSSARLKEAIKPMDKASEAILALQPVTFRYKHDLDPKGIPQFGLVAEEVQKVNPDLVACDEQGKPYTVRYEAINAMLLNEFLKEHKAFVEEQRKVQELEANAVRQQKQIEALSAGLQKVSAELATGRVRVAAATGLEMSKFATGRIRSGEPGPQTVLNNQ